MPPRGATLRRVEEGSSLWRTLSPYLRAAKFHWSGSNRERATANSFSSLNFCLGFDPTQFHLGHPSSGDRATLRSWGGLCEKTSTRAYCTDDFSARECGRRNAIASDSSLTFI